MIHTLLTKLFLRQASLNPHPTLINHLANQDKTHTNQHGFDNFTAFEMNHFGAIVAAYPLAYGHDEADLPDYMPAYDKGNDGGTIGKE